MSSIGDSRFWWFDKKGSFSVKSGYKSWLRANLRSHLVVAGPSTNGDEMWWKNVWTLAMPPKVKFFLWKLSRDFVATKGNLFKHHVPIDPSCFFLRS